MELKRDAADKIYLRIEKLKLYIAILEGLKDISLEDLDKDPVKRGAIGAERTSSAFMKRSI